MQKADRKLIKLFNFWDFCYLLRMEILPEMLERARTVFYLEGKSVADWARENNFRRDLVYAVLSGRSKANRGESHRIAVRLGLKPALVHPQEEVHAQQ